MLPRPGVVSFRAGLFQKKMKTVFPVFRNDHAFILRHTVSPAGTPVNLIYMDGELFRAVCTDEAVDAMFEPFTGQVFNHNKNELLTR